MLLNDFRRRRGILSTENLCLEFFQRIFYLKIKENFFFAEKLLFSPLIVCLIWSINYWFSWGEKRFIIQNVFSPMNSVESWMFAFVLQMLFHVFSLAWRRWLWSLRQSYQSFLLAFNAVSVCNGNRWRRFNDPCRCCCRCHRCRWLYCGQTCGLCGCWDGWACKNIIVVFRC